MNGRALILSTLFLVAAGRPREPASAAEESGPDAAEVYAAVAGAARDNLLSPEARTFFTEVILPELKEGTVTVNAAEEAALRGSEAAYDYQEDAVKIRSGATLEEEGPLLGFLIHELVHAGQDACRYGQSRRDSERDAYYVQAEFELRQEGVIFETEEGAILPAVDISEMDSMRKWVVYRAALKNAAAGKGGLNRFSDGSGAEFMEMEVVEAARYFREMAAAARDSAMGQILTASGLSDMTAKKRRDPDEFLNKDGLKKAGQAPAPEACKAWTAYFASLAQEASARNANPAASSAEKPKSPAADSPKPK
ncbi:MAG: hypothetical protein A3G41_01045 [Elusimicrobia bacterium RIFCSPLOWO2_12_FULL_59_9]|nr:MAG: hypothetical protein A3G41_01045 [Elusimicrobia bacterium RIFCSPLOWO2_12_FULL_59_9]